MLDSLDTLIAFVVIMLVVSMLVTICVQMVSAAANLRGRYLGQGLSHTFATILPDLWKDGKAQTLACRILSGRLLSDSQQGLSDDPAAKSGDQARNPFKRCATAVRPDEVFDALHRIATGRNQRLCGMANDARALLKGLGVTDAVLAHGAAEVAIATGVPAPKLVGDVAQMVSTANQILNGLPEPQRTTVEAAIKPLADRLNAIETAAVDKAAEVARVLDQACKKFKYWFEVSQERAQQWFTTHTRWLTVIFAIIFAFGLQLDTVEIFKFVSSNKTARDKLVAQVGAVTGQAERIVGDAGKVLQEALDSWRKTNAEEAAKPAVAAITTTASDTRGSVRAKLEAALGDSPAKAELLDSFEKRVDRTAEEKLKQSAGDFTSLKTRLDDTGFNLFVTEPGGRWHGGRLRDIPGHLLGTLFSVGLLSLGAPFWFNALKSLANLRSRVAQSISTEEQGEKLPPGKTAAVPGTAGPATPRVAPPTVMPAQ